MADESISKRFEDLTVQDCELMIKILRTGIESIKNDTEECSLCNEALSKPELDHINRMNQRCDAGNEMIEVLKLRIAELNHKELFRKNVKIIRS